MPPRTPLFHPKRYFDRVLDPIGIGFGVFVTFVLVEFAATAWLAFWLLSRAENAPDAARHELWQIMPAFFIGYIITAAIAIGLVTLVMHYVPSGENAGSIGDTLGVAGWAYAPNLIAVPLKTAWFRYDMRDLSFRGEDPQTFQAEIERVSQDIVGAVDFGIELVVVIWSVAILAYGVATVHDLAVEDTAKVAILVGIGSLALGLLL